MLRAFRWLCTVAFGAHLGDRAAEAAGHVRALRNGPCDVFLDGSSALGAERAYSGQLADRILGHLMHFGENQIFMKAAGFYLRQRRCLLDVMASPGPWRTNVVSAENIPEIDHWRAAKVSNDRSIQTR